MKQGGHINKLLTDARGKLEETHAKALKKAQEAYDKALAAFKEVEADEGSANYIRAQDDLQDARAERESVKKNETPELRDLSDAVKELVEDGKEANKQYQAFRAALRPLAKKAGESEEDYFNKVNERFKSRELSLDDIPEDTDGIKSWVADNLAGSAEGGKDGDGKGGKKKEDGKSEGTPAGKKTAAELAAEKAAEGGEGGASRGGGDGVSDEEAKNLESFGEKAKMGIGPSFTKDELATFVKAAAGDFGGEALKTDTLGVDVVSTEFQPSSMGEGAPLTAEQAAALQAAESDLAQFRAKAAEKHK